MKATIILAAAAIALAPSWANANFYFSPEDTVQDAITKLQTAMESVVRTAGSESRATSTHAYQLLTALIDNLETTYADSLHLTFRELAEERQKTFLEADNLIHSIREQVPFEELQRSVDTAREVLSDAVPFSNAPIVMDYHPRFVSPRERDDLLVSIWGSRLNGEGYSGHHLIINGYEIPANMTQSGALSFVVPRNALPFNQETTSFLPATLRITQKPGSILPWAEDDKTEFNLLFTVLPEYLGSLEIRRVIERQEREVKQFVSSKLAAEIHGGGTNIASDCEYPPHDYKFDLHSLEAKMDLRTAYKHDDTSPGTNVASVNITTETPIQICFNVIASVGCTECGGRTEGHFEVEMFRDVTSHRVQKEGPMDIRWGQDMHIDLVEQATSQTATLRLFDDISRAISLTKGSEHVFVNIEPDLDNNIVFIRPGAPWR